MISVHFSPVFSCYIEGYIQKKKVALFLPAAPAPLPDVIDIDRQGFSLLLEIWFLSAFASVFFFNLP